MTKRSDGLCQCRVYIGKDEKGKKLYKSFYGKTQKEAKRKADEFKNRKPTENISFQAVSSQYLAFEYQRVNLSQYNTKKARIEYFTADLGQYNIDDILPKDIQVLINRLAVSNPHTGKPTAKRTLLRYIDSISNVFDYAIDNKLSSNNPCKRLFVNKSAPQRQRTTLTEDERKKIESCPYERSWVAVFLIYTGLRVGEATALKWSDIDLKNKTITINKSYDFKSDEVKSPKTKAGYRTVPIPDKLIPYLHKGKGYVIKPVRGKRMTESAWKRLREKIVKESGVKFEFHQLRHTYASILYSAGVDTLTACNLLGHSDIKTTLSIYTHLEENTKRLNIDKLNEYLK